MRIVFTHGGLNLFKSIVAECGGKEGIPWMLGIADMLRQLIPGRDLMGVVPVNRRTAVSMMPVIKKLHEFSRDGVVTEEAVLRLFGGLSHFEATKAEGDMDAREFPVLSRPFLHTLLPVELRGKEAIWECGETTVVFRGLTPLFVTKSLLPVVHLAGITYVSDSLRPVLKELANEQSASEDFLTAAKHLPIVDYNGTRLQALTREAGQELGLT